MLTPYQFASNSPIGNIDLDGLESVPSIGLLFKDVGITTPDGAPKINPKTENHEVYKTVEVIEDGSSKGYVTFGFSYADKELNTTPEVMTAIPKPK